MQRRQAVPDPIIRLAQAQAGVVSRDQVLAAGLSRHALQRLLDGGAWPLIARGLYATTPAGPGWEGLAWGGLLLGGDGARLGPSASAHLHGLGTSAPDPIDVLVPEGRFVRIAQAHWVFVRERAGARSPRTVGELSRLTVEDSVLDLCSTASEQGVVALLTRAVQQRKTTSQRLLAQLEQRPRQGNRRLLMEVLADVRAGVQSNLERHYLNRVERAHDLPRGDRQVRRRLPYYSDVRYDPYRLLVELDGRMWHEGMGAFRDMDRDNRFLLHGMLTLRYGWYQVVGEPCRVAFQVASMLQTMGWPGAPSRCPGCVNAPELDLVS